MNLDKLRTALVKLEEAEQAVGEVAYSAYRKDPVRWKVLDNYGDDLNGMAQRVRAYLRDAEEDALDKMIAAGVQDEMRKAIITTVGKAKLSGVAHYLYRIDGRWQFSTMWAEGWLFKAYPGGRRQLSVAGVKMMEEE